MKKFKKFVSVMLIILIINNIFFSAKASADIFGGTRTVNSYGLVEIYPSISIGANSYLP